MLRDAYVNDTYPEIPTHVEVLHHIHEQADSNAPQRTDPLWAVVCVRVGLALLVASMAALGLIWRLT